MLAFSLSACEDIRVGKSRAELAQEQWRTDSLIKTIHYQMDSVAMDFNKLYIDAQRRINNGVIMIEFMFGIICGLFIGMNDNDPIPYQTILYR